MGRVVEEVAARAAFVVVVVVVVVVPVALIAVPKAEDKFEDFVGQRAASEERPPVDPRGRAPTACS